MPSGCYIRTKDYNLIKEKGLNLSEFIRQAVAHAVDEHELQNYFDEEGYKPYIKKKARPRSTCKKCTSRSVVPKKGIYDKRTRAYKEFVHKMERGKALKRAERNNC